MVDPVWGGDRGLIPVWDEGRVISYGMGIGG